MIIRSGYQKFKTLNSKKLRALGRLFGLSALDYARMLSGVTCPVIFTHHSLSVDPKIGILTGASGVYQKIRRLRRCFLAQLVVCRHPAIPSCRLIKASKVPHPTLSAASCATPQLPSLPLSEHGRIPIEQLVWLRQVVRHQYSFSLNAIFLGT